MNWLRLSTCALALTAACDKTVPFENTAPAKQTPGGGTTFPSLDGGFVSSMDASHGDGAMEAVIPDQPFTKPALLEAIADCALGRFREFNDLALALQTATAAFAASPDDQTRAAAQAAWRAAMSSWEQAELFSFGPSGPSSAPGGRDLRNEIYYFPNINTCLMDQQILNTGYTNLAQPGVKGLGALEYLLWKADAGNSCSASLAINAGNPSPWAKLDAATLTQRRGAYAKAAADALAASAKALLDAWDKTGGNFYATFTTAGSNDVYASDQLAFNAVNTAMFYLDKEFKDDKIAIPAGISMDCSTGICPQLVESPYSQASNDDLIQNLHAFRSLFQGCGGSYSGLGFDDWLREIGKPELAQNIIDGLALIQQQTMAFNEPLPRMVQDQLPAVTAMHMNVVTLANILKGEYKGALNFELPAAALGDND